MLNEGFILNIIGEILNVIKFHPKKGKYCQKEFDFLKKSEKLHVILNLHRHAQ